MSPRDESTRPCPALWPRPTGAPPALHPHGVALLGRLIRSLGTRSARNVLWITHGHSCYCAPMDAVIV